MPEPATAADIVRSFYAHWVEGRPEELTALWADDAVMETVFSVPPVPPETAPPVMRGGEVIRPFWRNIMSALQRRDLNDLWIRGLEEPDWALARFKGDMHTKDGHVYRNSYNNLIRTRGGKIVEYYEYSNPLLILNAFVRQPSIRSR